MDDRMENIQIELYASQWHSLLGYLDPTSSPYSLVALFYCEERHREQ